MQANNRLRVKLIVSLTPGVHLRKLQRQAGISFNSTRYHVDKLTKAREIVRIEDGGYSRLYPPDTSLEDRTLFTILQSETDQRILKILSENQLVTRKRLGELVGLAKSTMSEHLSDLVELGVVKTEMSIEGSLSYYLNEPEKVQTLLVSLNPGLLKKATGRFIDLWDF